jgi:hypothetical protein
MLQLCLSLVFPLVLLLQGAIAQTFQVEREVRTDTLDTRDTPVPHPLSWWTRDPLRLDEGRSLLFGLKAQDGHRISARDYRVEQKVTNLGVISNHPIVEIITTIYERPSLVLDTSKLVEVSPSSHSDDLPPTQWKSLLVKVDGSDQYVEIYRLQASGGLFMPLTSSVIYGAGPDPILGTFAASTGNGGGCDDEYWWFDAAGAHPIDFSPFNRAITAALPPDTVYTSHCGALHPEESRLESGVQKRVARCHACDWVGEIVATYRIQHGAALPVFVHFQPQAQE